MKKTSFLLAAALLAQPVIAQASLPSPQVNPTTTISSDVVIGSHALEHVPVKKKLPTFRNDKVLDKVGYPNNWFMRNNLKSIIRAQRITGDIGKLATLAGSSIIDAGIKAVYGVAVTASTVSMVFIAGVFIAPEFTEAAIIKTVQIAAEGIKYTTALGATGILSFFIADGLSRQGRAQIFYDILNNRIPEAKKLKWKQLASGISAARIKINEETYFLLHSDGGKKQFSYSEFLEDQHILNKTEGVELFKLEDLRSSDTLQVPNQEDYSVKLTASYNLSQIVDQDISFSIEKNQNYAIKIVE